MNLYVLYDQQQNKIIGEIKKDIGNVDKRPVFGAVDPESDTHIIQQIIIAGSTTDIKNWRLWLTENVNTMGAVVSENYNFSLNNVVIKQLDIISAPVLHTRT